MCTRLKSDVKLKSCNPKLYKAVSRLFRENGNHCHVFRTFNLESLVWRVVVKWSGLKHCKSAKLPWHHKFEHCFWSWCNHRMVLVVRVCSVIWNPKLSVSHSESVSHHELLSYHRTTYSKRRSFPKSHALADWLIRTLAEMPPNSKKRKLTT